MARFYTVALQPTLFGEWSLQREWGRIGCAGRIVSTRYASESDAAVAMARLLEAKGVDVGGPWLLGPDPLRPKPRRLRLVGGAMLGLRDHLLPYFITVRDVERAFGKLHQARELRVVPGQCLGLFDASCGAGAESLMVSITAFYHSGLPTSGNVNRRMPRFRHSSVIKSSDCSAD